MHLLGRLWPCALVAACSSAAFASQTYYVAVNGSDSNSGSPTKPWKTIQHACDSVASGDTVYVHAGKYVGRVIVQRSMTLSVAKGEKVTIDGTGVTIPDSDSGLVLINNVGHVTLNGFEIENFKTTNSSLCPIGVFVEGSEDTVQILNNNIHDIDNTGSNAASINALGLAVYGNSSKGAITNLLISGNQIHDTKTGNSETLTLNGNVNGFKVTQNSVHNVNNIAIDCIGFEGTSPIAGQDQARNGLVAQNDVSDVTSIDNPAYNGSRSSDGIYVDGGKGIVIERNTVLRADIGIEVTSEHGGHFADSVTTRNNLVTSSYIAGISIGGYDPTRGGTQNCTFVNNTLYGNDTTESGLGQFMVQYHTSGNIFDNNILVASSEGVFINALSSGVKLDYNVYYSAGPQEWDWNGQTYSTVAAFTKGTGNDVHSHFGNPGFINAHTGNFQLRLGSFAVGKGEDLGSNVLGTVDLPGNPRLQGTRVDNGCYELPSGPRTVRSLSRKTQLFGASNI